MKTSPSAKSLVYLILVKIKKNYGIQILNLTVMSKTFY